MKLILFFIIYTTFSKTRISATTISLTEQCELPKEFFTECGQVKEENKTSQLKELYPWHVAIYRQTNKGRNSVPINTCGGTLISKSVLLTAAHCLAEDANGSPRNIAEYYVAAGNDYREFNDDRDFELRQIRQIKKLVIPRVYHGHGSAFIGDIAIIAVDKPFVLSSVVQPACIGGFTNYSLTEDSRGLSVGWGLTASSRDPNTRLTKLSVPFVNLEKCRSGVSNEFLKYLNNEDKFCGIFTNGLSICATDNGGGVLYPEIDDSGVTRLYLHGVASVGLISGGSCETTQYSAFTAVKPYLSELCQLIKSTI